MEYINENGILTFIIRGEVDHHTCKTIIEQTDKIIKDLTPKKVVFSFGGTTFCDSSGIAYIMGRYRLLKSLDIPVEISDLSPCTEKIFKLAIVDKYIKINKKEEVR